MAQIGKIYPEANEFDRAPPSPGSHYNFADVEFDRAPPPPGSHYNVADEFNRAPPPPGSYYKVAEQGLPAPATYRRSPRGRSGCCCLLSCLCSFVTVLVILLGLTVLVFWLVIHPRAPQFDVENVHIDGLSSSLPINTNITFGIMARNPNKHMGIYYDEINVDVEAFGVSVGGGSIPSFYQGHENITHISGDLSSQNVPVNSDTLVLLSSNRSNLPLYAKVDVKARVKVGSIKSPKIKVKVRCDLSVDLTKTTGSQLNNKKCHVKW